MFGKLKDKLKGALSVFSKKAEEEVLEEKSEEILEEPKEEVKEKKKVTSDKSLKEKPVGKESVKKEKEMVSEKKVIVKKEKKTSKEEKKKESKIQNTEKKVETVETVEEQETVIPETTEEEIKEIAEEQPKEEKKGFFGKLFTKKKEEKIEEPVEELKELKETVQAEIPVAEETKETEETEESKEKSEEKSFLGKIKQSFTTKTISEEKFNDLFWELEIVLLENNVSVEVIERIKDDLKKELVDKLLPRDVAGKIQDTLQKTLHEILTAGEQIDLLSFDKKPLIIAFFGINGTGKTTSIAKLTHYFQENGKTVVLAACDTFRAAAIQQLEEHANKLNVKIIKHDYGSDAAAVAFDAIKYAEKNNIDVVLIDTAGRLHSNTNLMAELEKIIRVTKPDLKIFVGESITGNDCIEQARRFNELVEMDGAILTKADVDEKGGAPLSISYVIKKPILFLGMGQEYKDLEKFDAEKMLKRLGF
ncbi:MAG: signal recognition particle-docking protein FtsY [archaeon]|nr:signal recognition particle-docking protein FtsY [archaeon]